MRGPASADHFPLPGPSARMEFPDLTRGRAPTMSLMSKFKDVAGPVVDIASPAVIQALDMANPLVEMAKEKASPYVEQVWEIAIPYVEVARDLTAPLLEQAINKAGPYAERDAVTAGPIVEQALEMAVPLVEKAGDLAVTCVGAAVFTVDKVTGGRYHDQFENVNQLVGEALNGRLGSKS